MKVLICQPWMRRHSWGGSDVITGSLEDGGGGGGSVRGVDCERLHQHCRLGLSGDPPQKPRKQLRKAREQALSGAHPPEPGLEPRETYFRLLTSRTIRVINLRCFKPFF